MGLVFHYLSCSLILVLLLLFLETFVFSRAKLIRNLALMVNQLCITRCARSKRRRQGLCAGAGLHRLTVVSIG